jgi:hypothetical protein
MFQLLHLELVHRSQRAASLSKPWLSTKPDITRTIFVGSVSQEAPLGVRRFLRKANTRWMSLVPAVSRSENTVRLRGLTRQIYLQ